MGDFMIFMGQVLGLTPIKDIQFKKTEHWETESCQNCGSESTTLASSIKDAIREFLIFTGQVLGFVSIKDIQFKKTEYWKTELYQNHCEEGDYWNFRTAAIFEKVIGNFYKLKDPADAYSTIMGAIKTAKDEGIEVKFEICSAQIKVRGNSNRTLILRDTERVIHGFISGDVGPYPKRLLTGEEEKNDERIYRERIERWEAEVKAESGGCTGNQEYTIGLSLEGW